MHAARRVRGLVVEPELHRRDPRIGADAEPVGHPALRPETDFAARVRLLEVRIDATIYRHAAADDRDGAIEQPFSLDRDPPLATPRHRYGYTAAVAQCVFEADTCAV